MNWLTWMTVLLLTGLACQAADLRAADESAAAQPASRPATQTAPSVAPPATMPATQPATTQSAPATRSAAVDPAVEKLLDKVEAAGREFRTLSARLEYTELEILFADQTTYLGQIYYQKDPASKQPARFRIHFDKVKHGKRQVEAAADRDVAFFSDDKGQWLVTRDGGPKQFTKYQVARPGESVDPLKLGQGPFPVPFGQEKAEVLKSFDVKVVAPRGGDPKDTTCLELLPREKAHQDLKVKRIEIWVDADGLPRRIRTEDDQGNVVKTASFNDIGKNERIDPKAFDLPQPAGKDWEIRSEPLPPRAAGGR